MRKNHLEHIDRWVEYIKTHPNTWRAIHTDFIEGQLDNAYRVLNELSKTKKGCQKIVDIYGIKNLKGYQHLLKKLF